MEDSLQWLKLALSGSRPKGALESRNSRKHGHAIKRTLETPTLEMNWLRPHSHEGFSGRCCKRLSQIWGKGQASSERDLVACFGMWR